MTMRRAIAGVHADKKRRGDIIELEPDRKAALAVKEGLASKTPWENILASGTNIVVDKLDFSPKGDLLKKKYQHNTYKARGTVKVLRRNAVKDIQLEPKDMRFKVSFCDCLDNQGVPDLTIDSFEVLPA